MNVTDDALGDVFATLNEYKQQVASGDSLSERDAVDVEVELGRILLRPNEDGTSVDIHLIDEEDDFEYHSASSRISNHLMREIGFPAHGQFEPFTAVFASDRETTRVDFAFFE